MREKQLQGFNIPRKLDEDLAKEILSFFTATLFAPIVEAMNEAKETYFNSSNAIEDAIRSGRIQFSDGVFKGKFGARISKEFKSLGLKFDKRIKGYRSSLLKLPISLQVAISQTEGNYYKVARSMLSKVDEIDLEKAMSELDFSKSAIGITEQIEGNLERTLYSKIGVQVQLTAEQAQVISKDFTNNLKLFINDFAEEQIIALRQDIQDVVFAGIRAESLQKTLEKRFSISQNKAKFLARQEVALFTSKYKQAKYQGAGINKYKWSTSKDRRVREDHKELDGKIFLFSSPPVTNKDTGERNNPGEDFGCRCIPIPIIEA